MHRRRLLGSWRWGGAFFLPLLPRGRPLPLLVGGGGGGGVMEVTCGSYGWSSWGLVVRRSGRGISRPEGVDAVHRSWNSAGEPSCKLAKVLNEMNLTVTLTPGCH